MKKVIFSVLIVTTALCLSCNKITDIFSEVKFGEISQLNFEKEMLQNKIFNKNKDSLGFTFHMQVDTLKLPVSIYTNNDNFYTFGKFGKLRNLSIDLTDYESRKSDFGDFFETLPTGMSKSNVDKIYQKYVLNYGEPDSLIEKDEYDKDFMPKGLVIPKSKKAVWLTKNFKLTFNMPFPNTAKDKNYEYYYGRDFGEKASINYEMYNYKEECDRIRDSIRKTYQPNDIVKMVAYKPEWVTINEIHNGHRYNTMFKITCGRLERKDVLDPRRVKAIRYEIVITDLFKKELYRITDLTYELKNPLNPIYNSGGLVEVYDSNQNPGITYSAKFNEKNEKLENLKKYNFSNSVKCNVDIKSIVFDDGDILE